MVNPVCPAPPRPRPRGAQPRPAVTTRTCGLVVVVVVVMLVAVAGDHECGRFLSATDYTILLYTAGSNTRAFIQVDNELKYLVDGVAIHMNEGLVPMDLLPELADICTHHLATHWTSQSSRPSFQSCSNLRQRLDLRDCDPSQDGLLNPSTCLHIMQNTYLPEVVADSDYCSVKLCSNQDPSDGCVAVQMTTTLNHACVPHHLLDDLVYGGVPSTVHKSQEAHFIHVRKEEETLLLNLESHQLREIMLEQIKESCSPKQETNMASSASPSEHHCWNMSKEGPKPGLSCLLRPLWLPPQVPLLLLQAPAGPI